MKILILGSSGMLGHVVRRYFERLDYEVFGTTRNKEDQLFFDVNKNIYELEDILQKVKPDVVINCIGVLNKACEENLGLAILANSFLPHYIDSLSLKYNFKFIHISTDCVFDGKKGNYNEFSEKDAYSIYGKTKALGEVVNDNSVTLRTSIIGPDESRDAIGLFSWFMNQEKQVKGFSKVIWTGVTTIELAKQIHNAILEDLTGLYHVVNGEQIDKYSLLCLFKKYFKTNMVVNISEELVSDKSLIVTRNDYQFLVPSYEDMIIEMKNWMLENNDLYPNLVRKIC